MMISYGVQNYTRTVFDEHGEMPVPKDAEITQMNYEYYPEGLGEYDPYCYGKL